VKFIRTEIDAIERAIPERCGIMSASIQAIQWVCGAFAADTSTREGDVLFVLRQVDAEV
jgi:hypothetical protein